MDRLDEVRVRCPYCGAGFVSLIETAYADQQYVEDCRSCCSPIEFRASYDPISGTWDVTAARNDE